MKKVKQTQNRIENQGFSLLTVIVSVSFIGILGLLILYIAMANFQMKITDLKGKDSFYTAEKALEEVRTGLQEDVGEAMSVAYTKVLETYSKDSDVSVDATLDELRQASFKELFVKEMVRRLQKSAMDTSHYNMKKLQSYLDITEEKTFDKEKETVIVTNPSDKEPVMKKDMKDGVVLKNIKTIYVDAQGHASIIETDIRLGIPKVQFPTPSTLPDLMNMIVVANKGIICENTDITQTTVIQGSVYAGLLDKYKSSGTDMVTDGSDQVSVEIPDGTKLSVSSGDKFVCQGNINLGNLSSFSSGSTVSVWAQGINLSSSMVTLQGKTYLSDDITVNKRKNSKVTISGEYYGFGSPVSARASKNYSNSDDAADTQPIYSYKNQNRSDSSLSSAITINGKDTIMDLSGVQKIMLAGKNYIASSQISSGSSERKNESDIVTGESLTVKGTQLAYLVPSELIGDGTLTNPMTGDQYFELVGEDESKILNIEEDTPIPEWGNRSLNQIGVDADHPVQTVFYNDNASGDRGFVYFYLNFTDSAKAAEFMQIYYSSSDIKKNLNEYLSFYFGSDAGIKVNDPQAYLRYVTNGNILSFDGSSKNGKLNSATDAETGTQLNDEQVKYQNMWYTLNRKMIVSYDLLKKGVKDTDGTVDHDERKSDRSVFDNLVNEEGMLSFINSNGERSSDGSYNQYRFTAAADDGGLMAVMADNGGHSEFVINSSAADKLRLVVCTGDVRIESGVAFSGIIMAKGKITLGSGAQLISAPLDAAKVFQAMQPDTDGISPKNFFWEGDKYVLGNSTSTDGTSSANKLSNNTYDLAECVTYENWKKK